MSIIFTLKELVWIVIHFLSLITQLQLSDKSSSSISKLLGSDPRHFSRAFFKSIWTTVQKKWFLEKFSWQKRKAIDCTWWWQSCWRQRTLWEESTIFPKTLFKRSWNFHYYKMENCSKDPEILPLSFFKGSGFVRRSQEAKENILSMVIGQSGTKWLFSTEHLFFWWKVVCPARTPKSTEW